MATSTPRAASSAFAAAATVDLPEAGSPVIHTAKAGLVLSSTIFVHLSGIERFLVQNSENKGEKLRTHRFRKGGIPNGTRHDQGAKREKRRHDAKHFTIARLFDVALPEP